MQGYQRELRDLVRERGITQLLHFTRIENAQSILLNGLAGRSYLDEAGVGYLPTDTWRRDGYNDAFSTSIHDVYWDMLVNKQRSMGGEWAVFAIDASVLWTHRCRFCWQNASSSEITRKRDLPGPWSFNRMFEDKPVSLIDNRSYRGACDREPCEPTDKSAEVQVREPVDPELIVALAVASEWRKGQLEAFMSENECTRPMDVWKDLRDYT